MGNESSLNICYLRCFRNTNTGVHMINVCTSNVTKTSREYNYDGRAKTRQEHIYIRMRPLNFKTHTLDEHWSKG